MVFFPRQCKNTELVSVNLNEDFCAHLGTLAAVETLTGDFVILNGFIGEVLSPFFPCDFSTCWLT